MKRFTSWLLALQLLPTGLCASSVLDLSYKHYLDAPQLEAAIRASCPWENKEEKPDTLTVDVSCSILGDEEGFKGIVQALLPKESPVSTDPPVAISLVARGNQLTPKSLNVVLQTLLSSTGNQTNVSDVSTESVTINTTNNSVSSNLSGTFQESSSRSNSTSLLPNIANNKRRPWDLYTLDVGWNPLHMDLPGWKTFLKSLQKLIQTVEVCPKILHFDRCGLTPGACRAIGKVCWKVVLGFQ